LLQIADRPQWQTVVGGSRKYVNKMLMRINDARLNSPVRQVQRLTSGVVITTDSGSETFDAVVFACHSDQALSLLGAKATSAERQVLGAFRYQANHAVLHTDASALPVNRRAWAAWNCEIAPASAQASAQVCVHYLINLLQPLPWSQPVIVSLNPVRPIADDQVHARFDFEHPVFDAAAIAAQRRVFALQGRQRTWFCGAWCGYGFHEDGLNAGLAVADGISQAWAKQGRVDPVRAWQ
jgi:predicted NAD/FAD-binding protein